MIRSKLAAGIIAAATATALITAPAVNAQEAAPEVGAPQQIGNIQTSSEVFFQGLQQLSSADKNERQDGLNKIRLSPFAGLYHLFAPIVSQLLASSGR